MSRKARGSDPVRIDSGSALSTLSAPFPVDRSQFDALMYADPNRTAAAWQFTPRLMAEVVAQVRKDVVALVLRVRFVSRSSDAQMLGTAYRYASHCVRVRAGFDPFHDLRDDLIVDWTDQSIENPRSRARELSSLRRMRDARPKARVKNTRSVATRPYSDAEWVRLWESVQSSKVNGALMAVALLGRLGLRPGEATLADANSVLEVAGGVAVHAYETTGVVRVVPADTVTGELLRVHRDDGPGFLVRPTANARKNVIYDVMHQLRQESPQFAHVDSHRLRHTAVVRWMQMPIPFTVVCAALGISAQSRLAADLLRFVEVPNEGVVLRSYRDWMGALR